MNKAYGIITNPSAGNGKRAEKLDHLASLLGAEIYGREQTSAEGLRGLCKDVSGDYDVLVVAGGDGTLLDVINSAEKDTTLAYYPLGTFNAVGHSLGSPKDPTAAAANIIVGNTAELDLIGYQGTKFLFGGVGYDARVVQRREELKAKGFSGKKAYLRAIGEELFGNEELFDVALHTAQGSQIKPNARAVFVSTISHYGPRFNFFPTAKVAKDHDPCFFASVQDQSKLGFNTGLVKTLIKGGRAKKHTLGELFTLDEKQASLTLALNKKAPIHLHGNLHEESSTFRFDLLPNALRMIV